MDRRSFIMKAGTGALAATALSAPAIAQQNPKLVWRMTSSFPKELDTIFGGAQDIADQVSAITDGNFTIDVFPAGEIVPGLEAESAVSTGAVEAAHTSSYYFFEKDPAFAIATAIPFGLNARMQNAWYYQGNGTRLTNDFYRTQGIYALPAGNTGVQMGGWFRKELNTLDDFKGLRMRVAGLAGRVLQRIGVVPQQLAGGDILAALENGTLDAAEWVGPYDDRKLGLSRAARFYYYPGWWEGGTVIHAFFNLTKWNELPRHYRAALASACNFANTNMMAKYDMRNPVALKSLLSGGTVLRPFSQDILEACYAAATDIYTGLSAASPAFREIYEDQIAFKRDSYLWTQIGEYSFDTFMMIQQRSGRL